MPNRYRQLYIEVAKVPGETIYGLSKLLNMEYRRTHDYAYKLINEGKVKKREVFENGRRKVKLYPVSYTNDLNNHD